MSRGEISRRFAIPALLLLMPATEVLAAVQSDAVIKQDYTYVQSSLVFPWVMFFVFFALIMIPFFMVIFLAWSKSNTTENGGADLVSSPGAGPKKAVFNRIVLPALLAGVAVFSILLVLNAYQAMDLMEQYGTAAPTMLNARP